MAWHAAVTLLIPVENALPTAKRSTIHGHSQYSARYPCSCCRCRGSVGTWAKNTHGAKLSFSETLASKRPLPQNGQFWRTSSGSRSVDPMPHDCGVEAVARKVVVRRPLLHRALLCGPGVCGCSAWSGGVCGFGVSRDQALQSRCGVPNVFPV